MMEIGVGVLLVVAFLLLSFRRIYARRTVPCAAIVVATAVMAVGVAVLVWPAVANRALFPYAAPAVMLGLALGIVGARRADVRRDPGGITHQADRRLGTLVFAVFIAFVCFRIARFYGGHPVAGPVPDGGRFSRVDWSPVVVFFRTTLFTYFVAYPSGLLYRYRKLNMPE
jgi:hypothetical protein